MHRTQSAYEDAYTLKLFLFQFVNNYAAPLYVAFFKGRFVGYPGNYNTVFRLRIESCDTGGCLIELAQEMLTIMLGKQITGNIKEFIMPKIKRWFKRKDIRGKKKESDKDELKPWERDYALLECSGMFSEYLEIDAVTYSTQHSNTTFPPKQITHTVTHVVVEAMLMML
ncbi:anoctamin-7-like [Discoglossus pictus]